MSHFIQLMILVVMVSSYGCKPKQPVQQKVLSQRAANEALVGANKVRLKLERKKIDAYIKRRRWDMTETESGLRYFIYEHGDADMKPQKGQIAVIDYQVRLTNGTLCYSSDSTGTKGFEIGKGEIERGIDEGIMLLNKGDKAKFVLPSHLAHGLLGDEVKIPSHAILVYDVSLIDIH
ncbi:MAG: FKBP-type peptidyl-prolyl cis-trans isomerase [Flavobacteriales bacterium]|nr:FKBP-type peptidyl-prolyl cis-trans isomerase [Flavobacteriales bacterium]